jgi:hypothetical protein
MGATLDDLVTILSAETATFKGQINDAVRAVDQGNAKMTASVSKLDTLFSKAGASLKSAFAIGAIVGASTALIRMEDTLEVNAANLKDMALQASVSYEALQRLRFAADQNGSSAEAMDTALAKLTKSIGEARGGSEQLSRIFKVLGLDDLIKKGASTEAVFFGLSDALKQIKDPAERSAVVLALMGKSSGTLADMMGQGAAAVHEMAAAMPAVAIRSDDLINKLDASHDRTVALTQDLQGAGSVLAGWFVDGLHAAGEAATGFINKLIELDNQLKVSTTLQQAWSLLQFKMGGMPSVPNTPASAPVAQQLAGKPPSETNFGKAGAVNQRSLATLFDPSVSGKAAAATEKYDHVIASLSNQLKELGMSEEHAAYQQELFSALQRAGVTEDSARGQAIVQLVAQIDNQRQAIEAVAEAEQHRAEAAQEAQQLQQQLGETFADSVSSVAAWAGELGRCAASNLLQSRWRRRFCRQRS